VGPHRDPGSWHHHAGYHHNDWINDRWDHWDDYWRWRAINGAIRLGAYYLTRPRYYTMVYYDSVYYYYYDGVYYLRDGGVYTVVAAPVGVIVPAAPATYETIGLPASTSADEGQSTAAVNHYLYANGAFYQETAADPSVATPAEETTENTSAEAASGEVTADQKKQAQTDPNVAKGEKPEQLKENPDPGTNYQVTAPPMGASVAHLPDDAVQKKIGDITYYTYSGTWYQAFSSGTTVVYMVVDPPTGTPSS
jgi:hypothetical protein